MLYIEVGFHQFAEMFKAMGRGDNFSYQGLEALYNHLDSLSDDIGEPIELDVIGLCCEYSEVESVQQLMEDQGWDLYDLGLDDDEDDEDVIFEAAKEKLENHTSVVCFEDGCIVYQVF
ncbi:MAG: hypothetical protein RBQ99_01670 [Trichlorobacter sp.]|nr:hypothetical protein [Trichlorobacter sp.]